MITRSINQYLKIKAQRSGEIQPLEFLGNVTVVFDDMLLSKQSSNIGLYFTRVRHKFPDISYKSQSFFHLPKNAFRNFSKILLKQTLRDMIQHFHDLAG